MSNKRISIGIGLIVRNEENDLPTCLKSFIPAVDYVCLIDTGSTDNTVKVAKQILEESGIAHYVGSFLDASDSDGRLCDFSRARNEYVKHLEKVTPRLDYLMSVDADDTLETADIKSMMVKHPADFYAIRYRMNPDFWFNSYKVWRNGMGIRYEGRVHECLKIDWSKTIQEIPVEFLHHFTVNPLQESGTDRNMRILRSEIYPPLRSIFYWANENVDAKNYHEAVKWYQEYIRRVTVMGEQTWDVELAHCYFRCARWLAYLGHVDKAIALSKQLLDRDPSWSEAWCELSHLAYCQGDYELSAEYAMKALTNKFTPRLFSEPDKYSQTPASLLSRAKAKQFEGVKNEG